MREFNGKVAVVTGGASGVGRCLAERLAAEGAKVVITDINVEKLASVAADLDAASPNGSVEGIACDVTREESVQALADAVFAKYGRVDLLFNNAGVGLADMRSPFWSLPMKDWQWGFGVHVMGPVHGIKAFVPRMIEQDGEGFVVNTTSGNGALHSLPNTPIYASSKAALTSLTEVLYAQLKEKAPHIRVGILFPGPRLVNTSLLDSPRPDEYRDPSNPLPKGVAMSDLAERMGGIEMTEPDDVAAYCLACVKQDQFWMLHPESGMDGFETRVSSIRERSNP
ncbi:MAG: SDR family NAD(P)-dependent oxidoreductase [Alphaproteobacteria bacterium]|nr:SDR family NAD(P)-dependent oxidoreductase [Alphaproteobacteria bacterium]